jgi:hypothetical protein
MAEGEVLAANSLPVEERILWDDCGYWRLASVTQDYAPPRHSETAVLTSYPKLLFTHIALLAGGLAAFPGMTAVIGSTFGFVTNKNLLGG